MNKCFEIYEFVKASSGKNKGKIVGVLMAKKATVDGNECVVISGSKLNNNDGFSTFDKPQGVVVSRNKIAGYVNDPSKVISLPHSFKHTTITRMNKKLNEEETKPVLEFFTERCLRYFINRETNTPISIVFPEYDTPVDNKQYNTMNIVDAFNNCKGKLISRVVFVPLKPSVGFTRSASGNDILCIVDEKIAIPYTLTGADVLATDWYIV
jgi:hypothetical protein